ncbi:MAG: cobalamin biosynthesis protein [Clostridiales bacterium]|nr:cobalamin biosynthesis protein [Clostridiales bacterium]
MKIAIISFTRRGAELSRRMRWQIEKQLSYEVALYTKCSNELQEEADIRFVEETLGDWTKEQFEKSEALIFIGACGIAVRAIAPFLKSKLTDIPVLVAEESGNYVIPILSGHYGGGNELAAFIAEGIGATAVITTATDVNGLFAVDVFAKKNHLLIGEKKGIAKVSEKLLEEKHITLKIEGSVLGAVPPEVTLLDKKNEKMSEDEKLQADVLVSSKDRGVALLQLYPKSVVLGMGCKKGKTCEEIEAFVLEQLGRLHISIKSVGVLATIDCKKEEQGFLDFAEKYGLCFLTFGKEELEAVEGDFASSSFVKQQVGIDNVCERAAVAAATEYRQNERQNPCCDTKEKGYCLLLKKTAKNGMTLAVAEKKWSVTFDET